MKVIKLELFGKIGKNPIEYVQQTNPLAEFVSGLDRIRLAVAANFAGADIKLDGNISLRSAADAVEMGSMEQLLGHSITYRIAVGPQQGRRVFTLQTLPACDPEDQFGDSPGNVAGFSLHASVAAKAHERDKLERLCRYIARPAVSEKRLSLTAQGKVRYELKTPYRDGTTHVIFEPLDFMYRMYGMPRSQDTHRTPGEEDPQQGA